MNFDVKNIVLAKKAPSSSDSSSPYFSETASLNGGGTPSFDDLYNAMAALKLYGSGAAAAAVVGGGSVAAAGGGGIGHLSDVGGSLFGGAASESGVDDLHNGVFNGSIGVDDLLHGIDSNELKSGLVD